MTEDLTWNGVMRLQLAREAIASTALSHAPDCECDVCRADDGDRHAFARVLAIMFDPDGGP
jgi:hypothetical protein